MVMLIQFLPCTLFIHICILCRTYSITILIEAVILSSFDICRCEGLFYVFVLYSLNLIVEDALEFYSVKEWSWMMVCGKNRQTHTAIESIDRADIFLVRFLTFNCLVRATYLKYMSSSDIYKKSNVQINEGNNNNNKTIRCNSYDSNTYAKIDCNSFLDWVKCIPNTYYLIYVQCAYTTGRLKKKIPVMFTTKSTKRNKPRDGRSKKIETEWTYIICVYQISKCNGGMIHIVCNIACMYKQQQMTTIISEWIDSDSTSRIRLRVYKIIIRVHRRRSSAKGV